MEVDVREIAVVEGVAQFVLDLGPHLVAVLHNLGGVEIAEAALDGAADVGFHDAGVVIVAHLLDQQAHVFGHQVVVDGVGNLRRLHVTRIGVLRPVELLLLHVHLLHALDKGNLDMQAIQNGLVVDFAEGGEHAAFGGFHRIERTEQRKQKEKAQNA